MDFSSPFFIPIMAALVGWFCATVFIFGDFRSHLRLFAISYAISLILNESIYGLWAMFSDAPATFVIELVSVVAAYNLIGCIAGILPILLGRYVFRKLRLILSD